MRKTAKAYIVLTMLQALCKAFLYINSIPHNNLIRQVLLWLPFADEKTEAMK